MPRAQNLEFGAPGKRQRVVDVGTSSSGRSLRKTMLPRRLCNSSSSSSSSEDSEHDGAEEYRNSGAGQAEERFEDMNAPSSAFDIFSTRPSLRGLSIEEQRSTRLSWLVANKKLSAEAATCASDQDVERAWRRPDRRNHRAHRFNMHRRPKVASLKEREARVPTRKSGRAQIEVRNSRRVRGARADSE